MQTARTPISRLTVQQQAAPGRTQAAAAAAAHNNTGGTTTATTNNDNKASGIAAQCIVCYNKLSATWSQWNAVAAADAFDACGGAHDRSICRYCSSRYIREQVYAAGHLTVRCPMPECRAELSNADVARVSPEAANFIAEAQLRAYLHAAPDVVVCPFAGCALAQWMTTPALAGAATSATATGSASSPATGNAATAAATMATAPGAPKGPTGRRGRIEAAATQAAATAARPSTATTAETAGATAGGASTSAAAAEAASTSAAASTVAAAAETAGQAAKAACPHVRCIGCRNAYCAAHSLPWDSCLTCNTQLTAPAGRITRGAAARLAGAQELRASLEAVQKAEFRRCAGCGSAIEKNGGCNHMVCRCGRQFDWASLVHMGR